MAIHGLGKRTADVLGPTNQDALWHCELCEQRYPNPVAFSTLILLEAHINAGHPRQTWEELETERTVVRAIDAQTIPEPIPVASEVGAEVDGAWGKLVAMVYDPEVTNKQLGKALRRFVQGTLA